MRDGTNVIGEAVARGSNPGSSWQIKGRPATSKAEWQTGTDLHNVAENEGTQ